MKKIFLAILFLILLSSPAFATPYFVRPGGNDSTCDGTQDEDAGDGTCAKANPQAAVDLATSPGDTVTVRAGTYTGFTSAASGSSGGGYITIKGYAGETVNIRDAIITHDYIRLENFRMTDAGTLNDAHGVRIDGSDHVVVINCFFYGTAFASSAYAVQAINASYIYITDNIFEGDTTDDHTFWTAIYFEASNTFVTGNKVRNLMNVERVFVALVGPHNFSGNEIYNIRCNWVHGDGVHPDLFQTFNTTPSIVVFEKNYVHDCELAILMIRVTSSSSYTLRNNIFANISLTAQFGDDSNSKAYVYNNLFYRVGYTQDEAITVSWGQVYNNAFIGCGSGDAQNNGFYSRSDGYGGYNLLATLSGGTKNTAAFPSWLETDINGGTLNFVAPYTNCLSSTCNFNPNFGSSFIDAVTTNSATGFSDDYLGVARPQGTKWDIGPYEFTGSGEDIYAPVITSNTMNGTTISCASETTVPIETNENATCRISETNETYDAMTSAKNMAGAGTKIHTATVGGLACGTAGTPDYTRYVRCADTIGNKQTSSTAVAWDVAAAATSEAPIFSGQYPSGNLACTGEDVGIGGVTNKDATCKWDTSDTTYALMANTYSTPTSSPLARSGRWLYYNGSPIWLVGYDLQQLFNDATYNEAAVKVYIDTLATYGATAFRVWMHTWFLDNPGTDYYPYQYADGEFKLGTFDEDYFTRWKTLIAYAKTKGIMVEIVIFSEYPENDDFWNVDANYWLAAQNNKTYFENTGDGYFWPEFLTWDYTEDGANLTTIQKALIDKAIEEFNPIGNVFFLLHNEHPAGTSVASTYQWQQQMADYMKSKGAITFVHGHENWGLNLTGLSYWNTRDSIDGLAFHPYSTAANDDNIDEIGSYWGSSSMQAMDKVVIFDESHAYDVGSAAEIKATVRELFASFVNRTYYLAYWDAPFTVGGADWITKAGAITTLKNISSQVAWWEMTHANSSIVSSGPGPNWQGMYKSGEYYVYYFTGTVTEDPAVIVTLPTGTYDYKWYDTRAWDADGIKSGTVSAGSNVEVAAPEDTDWDASYGVVLVVIKQGVSPTTGTTTHTATYPAPACGQVHNIYTRCTDGVNTATSSVLTTFNMSPLIPSDYIEAETGTLAGAMSSTADAGASAGYYISTGTVNSGTATFTVTVATAGTYRIVARWFAEDSGTDSMFLQVNAEDEIVWDFNPTSNANYFNAWIVDSVKSRGTGSPTAPQYDPYLVTLTADDHTFVFRGREVRARLDYFYLMQEDIPVVNPEITPPTGWAIIGSAAAVGSAQIGGPGVGSAILE